MSVFADAFLQSVAAEIDAREQKMKAISNGLESFFEKLFQTEFPALSTEVILSLPKDNIVSDGDCYSMSIRASEVIVKDVSSLEIGVNTAGNAYVRLWGDEFKESDEEGKDDNEGSSFDCDSYTPAQTVAKLLALVQKHDPNIFGPRIAQVLKDIQAEMPTPKDRPGSPRPCLEP